MHNTFYQSSAPYFNDLVTFCTDDSQRRYYGHQQPDPTSLPEKHPVQQSAGQPGQNCNKNDFTCNVSGCFPGIPEKKYTKI